MHTRRNVWDLGDDWADPVVWYARGVAAMKARALDDPTGWRFYGGIHGYLEVLWQFYGYKTPSDPLPSQDDRNLYWDQCQHGSWYFLPWHRGYLIAFEKNVREAIKAMGGPEDWALPYWNYFKAGQNSLPPAFASPDWPDGQGDNPLFVEQRWGPDPNDPGNVFIPLDDVNLDAMSTPDFTGVASGGDPGFGGVDTGFSHGGQVHGDLESQPHDLVHVLVGGSQVMQFGGQMRRLPGLMSTPPTAGLDPIFWLHHGNIDRLWESWRQNPPTHVDPTDAKWLNGPAGFGERSLSMPLPDGSRWDFTPEEMSDFQVLDYTYDDLTPGDIMPVAAVAAAAGAPVEGAVGEEAASMANVDKTVELVGASEKPLSITGAQADVSVRLDTGMRNKVMTSMAAELAPSAGAERILLNLENVRGQSDATILRVYVALPEQAGAGGPRERKVGSVGLFGVNQATNPDDDQAGQGLTYVLDVTNLFGDLVAANNPDVDTMNVRIEPLTPVAEEEALSIGRISLVRQGR